MTPFQLFALAVQASPASQPRTMEAFPALHAAPHRLIASFESVRVGISLHHLAAFKLQLDEREDRRFRDHLFTDASPIGSLPAERILETAAGSAFEETRHDIEHALATLRGRAGSKYP